MLTLIPPCYIAYLLMPTGSPLRPWLTLGVFLFGILAILSPLPDEVFRIPRDRKSYLRLLTDSYLTELDVEQPRTDFQKLAPRTVMRLTAPTKEEPRSESKSRDPWMNPFTGTGRTISRTGKAQKEAETRDMYVAGAEIPLPARPAVPAHPEANELRPERPVTSPASPTAVISPPPIPIGPVIPSIPVSTFGSVPGDVTREKNIERTPVTGFTGPTSVSTSRRPLRDPETPGSRNMGFQSPSGTSPLAGPGESIPLSMISLPVAPAIPPRATVAPAAIAPAAPVQPRPLTEAPRRPLSDPTAARVIPDSTISPLRELDRRLQAEADDEDASDTDFDMTGAASGPVPGLTQSMQSMGDFHLERVKDEHGGEMIEGKIMARFEIGQKRAHLHVPFSPPLQGIPEVECEPVGDEPVRLKVAVRQPYGIRIEVRRTEASDPLTAEISFAAVYTPTRRV